MAGLIWINGTVVSSDGGRWPSDNPSIVPDLATPSSSATDSWDWPGSRWWRCDLHLHTPGSYDYSDPKATADDLVAAAINAALDAIAVTDHNTAAFVDLLQAAAERAEEPVVVFPGVELTSAEGAHLIVLFPPGSDADVVKAYLGACGIPAERWGKDDAHASETYVRCIKLADDHGAISFAAHADRPATGSKKPNSLLHTLEGQALLDVLKLPQLHAAEVATTEIALHEKLVAVDPITNLPMRPCLFSSDAHALGQVGSSSSWIKMTTPDQEGLRLALADGRMSVRAAEPTADPNQHASLAIESVEIGNGKLMGRGEPLVIQFNPWLNALIGGRGTGKSSVVEFIRLALRRDDELPEGLRAGFREFAKVGSRTARGLLTAETRATVIYRKDGSRFRVQWQQSGVTMAIEEFRNGAWTAAEGSVNERFPVRIYSQKQIFEIAEGPESLLRVIDDSILVNRIEWDEHWRTAEAEFLSLRAQARQLEARLADEGRLKGHLDDINKKLAVFESSHHSDVLRGYRERQDQLRAVADWEQQLVAIVVGLHAAAGDVTSSFRETAFDASLDPDAELLAAIQARQDELAGIRARVEGAAALTQQLIDGWEQQKQSIAWTQTAESANQSYAELLETLASEGAGSPEEYGHLVEERKDLLGRLRELEQARSELDELNQHAATALEGLHELRRDLTRRRREFLQAVLTANKHVRISVVDYGDQGGAEPGFRDLIGRDPPGFQNDIAAPEGTGLIPSLYQSFTAGDGPDFETKLNTMRQRISDCARGIPASWDLRDRRFEEFLHGLSPETIDRLAYWSPQDSVDVEYSRTIDGADFVSIQQGSPGQKTAAILAFLLAYGEEPIILDQPEDDLDNTLIYDLIVQQLRENKQRRQIIVVTHNANIVVNGDAEYVVALDFRNGRTQIVQDGGLQQRLVRETVCAVMEGGRSAFEQRYQRIGRPV